MSTSLFRLGRGVATRPWPVIGAWAALLVLLAGLAIGLGGSLSSDLEISGTEAQEGLDTLNERFPELAGGTGQVVFTVPDGQDVDDRRDEIQAVMKDIADINGVAAAPDPFGDTAPGVRNSDDTALLGTVQMDGDLGEFPPEALDELERVAEESSTDDLSVQVGGQIFTMTEVPLSIAEVIGLIAAFVVLGVTFRAVVPAVLPILSALMAVGSATAAVLSLAAGVSIPSVTLTLALMLGLAVGIDYALFILSRHRSQLAEGMDVRESIGRSIATSGSAVIFAGATVIIALVGLFITRIGFLTVMGLASAFTVFLAVLISLTLLPALMGLLGERMRPRPSRRDRRRARTAAAAGESPSEEPAPRRRTLFDRWAALITRVPLLTMLLVIAAVTALIIPAKDLALALPDQGTDPEGSPTRITYDLISDDFGEGYTAPLLVTADIINTDDPLGVMDSLEEDVRKMDGVHDVQISTPNRSADMGVLVVIPEEGQASESTANLVQELRDTRGSWEKDLGISDVTVTGQTAAGIDITEKLSAALVPFLVFVVGLSLVLLTIVFRSLWVPLKATVGFLLSIGSAFGVVAMVFEYGWGNDLLGVGMTGPVISFLPILVTGVLFGLAMDYEVFLVSRMREDFVHTGDAKHAVRSGFAHSAPVVVAAALIMLSVFGSFVPESTYMIQPIAVALAVGVAVDAFLVRMTLVPAILTLLGRRAWHLPAWLDARLPHLDTEGEGLAHLLEHREWTNQHGRSALRLDGLVVPRLSGDGSLGPITTAAAPGTLLVLRSTDDDARRSLLAAIAGRLAPSDGVLAVYDRLAADQLTALQARVYRLPSGGDLVRELRRIPAGRVSGRVVLIPSVEELAEAGPEAVAEIESMLRREATVVVGSKGAESSGSHAAHSEQTASRAERRIADMLEDPSRMIAFSLPLSPHADTSASASAQEPATPPAHTSSSALHTEPTEGARP